MRESYFKIIVMIERLHFLFKEVMEAELDRMNINDIRAGECFILYSMGNETLKVGDFTDRGYFLGSNITYSLKKMVKNGYLFKEKNIHDYRSNNVTLTDKGKMLRDELDALFSVHAKGLFCRDIGRLNIENLDKNLIIIERLWKDIVKNDYKVS